MFGEMEIRTEDREDLEEMERECEEAIAALKEQMDPMKEKLGGDSLVSAEEKLFTKGGRSGLDAASCRSGIPA